MYHPVNTRTGVLINDPDALGTACKYVRYGHYLGGTRTYLGLPNNPDYSLGPVAGLICDSLTTNVTAPPLWEAGLHLFYHPDWKQLFVNASGIKGHKGQLQLYNTTGALLHTEPASIQPPLLHPPARPERPGTKACTSSSSKPTPNASVDGS